MDLLTYCACFVKFKLLLAACSFNLSMLAIEPSFLSVILSFFSLSSQKFVKEAFEWSYFLWKPSTSGYSVFWRRYLLESTFSRDGCLLAGCWLVRSLVYCRSPYDNFPTKAECFWLDAFFSESFFELSWCEVTCLVVYLLNITRFSFSFSLSVWVAVVIPWNYV